MRLRNVKNKKEILESSAYLVFKPEVYKGCWRKLFNNDNPIYIEIGMGKGDFIIQNALLYPNINFIGIEKYDSVMARAVLKAKSVSENGNIDNLKFVRLDAKDIEDVFDCEIDRIYLNFSDPWPKKRHSERRLSSTTFLKHYDHLFKGDFHITLKTDNVQLFEFSLESLSKYGYYFEKVSFDLHNSDLENNIFTEYERKFSEKGVPIKYLDAKRVSILQKKS